MSKVTTKLLDNNFKPVELRITIETQQELNALFCIFNHDRLSKMLLNYGVDSESIYKELSEYKTNYDEPWESLRELIP